MFAPSAATLLLVGDITPAEARTVAQQAFGSWNTTRPALGPVANPARASTGTRIILVDRPGSVQSSIVVGQPGFQATDPDYISMLALNHVFGGAVSSRLNTNLREKRGYTYGIFSGLDLRPGGVPSRRAPRSGRMLRTRRWSRRSASTAVSSPSRFQRRSCRAP